MVLTPSRWGGHDEIPFMLKLDGRGYMLQFYEAYDASRGCGMPDPSRMCGTPGPKLVGQVRINRSPPV